MRILQLFIYSIIKSFKAKSMRFFSIVSTLLLPLCARAFAPSLRATSRSAVPTSYTKSGRTSRLYETVRLTVDLPPSGSDRTATMKIEPCLSVPSEMIEVRYKVPFDLNVAPQKNLAVCTKGGPGGEKEGDILRYTSQWTLGLPQGDGLVTTAAAFSGT